MGATITMHQQQQKHRRLRTDSSSSYMPSLGPLKHKARTAHTKKRT